MAVQLEQVVPFGRSLAEYIQMFNLTDADLQTAILGVGDGPASFNAEGTRLGYRIKSIDLLYVLNALRKSAIAFMRYFYAVVDQVIAQVEQAPDDWVWTYHGSPAGLRQNRERVTQLFCEDFDQRKHQDCSRLSFALPLSRLPGSRVHRQSPELLPVL